MNRLKRYDNIIDGFVQGTVQNNEIMDVLDINFVGQRKIEARLDNLEAAVNQIIGWINAQSE